jgi:uncharacterized delta-60 repeat protein
MGQRELDLSCSAFGINRDGSGRQYLGLNLKPLLLLRGMFTLLFCGSLAGCLTPDGTISFNDSSLVSQFTGPGSLIPSFGNQGTVLSFQMMLNFGSHGLTVDSGGRMLVTGFIPGALPNTSAFAIGRFNPDGSIDTTFGPQGNGISTFQYTANSDEKACAVVIDPADQSIVVAGRTLVGTGTEGLSVRSVVFEKLDPNGNVLAASTFSPDNPGNTSQLVLTTNTAISDNGDDDSCVAMVNLPLNLSNDSNGYVAAYSMAASGDPTTLQMVSVHIAAQSNSIGLPTTSAANLTGTTNYVYDLQLTPNCTQSNYQAGTCAAVVLGAQPLNTTNGMGNNSMVTWNIDVHASSTTSTSVDYYKISSVTGAEDTPRAGLFDASGNLLVTGYSSIGSGNDAEHVFFLVRLLESTSWQTTTLDPLFGNLGYAYNPFTTQDSAGFALTLDPQQRILVGGGFTGNGTGLDQAVLRYQPDGFLDQSFGPYGGLTTNEVTGLDDVVTGIYYDTAHDRILTVGFGAGNVNAQDGASDGGLVSISAYTPQ